MEYDLSRLQCALLGGIAGTVALLLSAYVFDYPTVQMAVPFGVMTTVVFYGMDVRHLADVG